ncbi:hypothetical protein N7490_010741 [Penicillium lividum]|nr:hypothetical protein N7490_010741 [Penicillium lividum]
MSAERHFRCNICQQSFTRSDHLKRHHLRRMHPTLLILLFKTGKLGPYGIAPILTVHSPTVTVFATTIHIVLNAENAVSQKIAGEAGGDMLAKR